MDQTKGKIEGVISWMIVLRSKDTREHRYIALVKDSNLRRKAIELSREQYIRELREKDIPVPITVRNIADKRG